MAAGANKKILITGGAGFVGRHLCATLLQAGHRVHCLDNFYTGTHKNIADFLAHPNFSFTEQDVCKPIEIEADEIYHLACPASPVHYQRDPIYTAKISFLGALHVLECAKNNHAKVLLASTSEVYGNPLVHPQPETYLGHVNPIGPRACYDEGKRISETLFMDSTRMWQANIRIARIFNTYGPFMQANDGRIISNFIVQALHGNPLTVYGDGQQTRSFCYVSDTVNGLMTLMQSDYDKPVNLGNPIELTVLEIAKKIQHITQSNSKIVHQPLPQDDPLQRKPDITLAQKMGFNPSVPLEEGLNQTIAYFRQQQDQKVFA